LSRGPIHVGVRVREHDQGADAVACQGREHALEFIRAAGFIRANLPAERALPFGDAAFECGARNRVGIEQNADPARTRHEFANEL
jgi:hypothetical protein